VTGIIKPGAAGFDGRIRPLVFDGFRASSAPEPDPELVGLRRRVADLEVLMAERDAAAERLAAAVEAAFADGEAEGREAGRSEAEDRSGEALALLRASADRAAAALEKRLEAADRLAALLAKTCLAKMFGNRDARSDLVRGLISHQIEALREEMIVEVRVSTEDFASAEAAAAAAPACAVTVSDALSSGDCTIRLQLGALDIGLGQQWGVLRAALDGMIGGEGEV
jgi:type III secretion protein L